MTRRNVGFLALCIFLTPLQVRRWKDSATLFSYVLSSYPDNWLAHLKLGEDMRRKKDLQAAEVHLRQAVDLNPSNFYARTLLGVTLGELGAGEEALRVLEESLRLEPNWPDTRYNLAVTLANSGRIPEAKINKQYTILKILVWISFFQFFKIALYKHSKEQIKKQAKFRCQHKNAMGVISSVSGIENI